MLILADKSLLGDGPNGQNLRDAESEARLLELNERDLGRYRWPDQPEMVDAERRAGQRMHHTDLLRRVTRLNPAIFAEPSLNYDDSMGFYHVDPGSGNKRYLSCFLKGDMPEFSSIRTDWQNIPEHEVRGWRTVLVRLLSLRALTWRQVSDEFGDPVSDCNARRWYAETREFRN